MTQPHQLGTAVLLLAAAGCVEKRHDCNWTLTCGGDTSELSGGSAGTAGSAGNNEGGSSASNIIAGSSGTGAGETTGGTSNAGAAPCNGACTGATPICEATLNQCVACTKDTECPTSTVCDTASHVCVGCTEDANCSGATPACDTTNSTCVTCTKDTHCPTSAPACKMPGNTCVGCTTAAHCPASKSICDTDNTCVQCVANTDCSTVTGKNACKTATKSCVECVTSADCKDASESVCDTTTNACVGCLSSTDCADSTKPGYNASKLLCKAETKACVSCLANTDCKTAGASKCDLTSVGGSSLNACVPCTDDVECTQVVGKNVCLAGVTGQANQCVQCTAAKVTACGANSCNPKTSACTTTPKNSIDLCGACVADSECKVGGTTTIARCIPMTFGPSATPRGSYCLEAVSSGCDNPFGSTTVVAITAISTSGAPSAAYCGINQEVVTCEAIRDMQDVNDTVRCSNVGTSQPEDALCGCTRNAAGVCTSPGIGGLCRSINGANRCTIQCSFGYECPNTCVTPAPNYCG